MASSRPTASSSSGKRAFPGGKAPMARQVSLEGEKVEETAVYTISANHGMTARVSFWNGRALLQLRALKQDAQGDSRRILVTLEAGEVELLSEHIVRAREILEEHPDRGMGGPARLFYRCLSTADSGRHRYLDVSRWQGLVKASVRRFFVNDQGHVCPTKDGVQFTLPHLVLLQRLLPLIKRDFAVADRIASQLSAREQDTLQRIMAMEAEQGTGPAAAAAAAAPMGPPTKTPKKSKKRTKTATVSPTPKPNGADLVERAATAAGVVVDLTAGDSTGTDHQSSDDDDRHTSVQEEEYSQWQPEH